MSRAAWQTLIGRSSRATPACGGLFARGDEPWRSMTTCSPRQQDEGLYGRKLSMTTCSVSYTDTRKQRRPGCSRTGGVATRKCHEEEMRATKSAGLDTAQKKSRGKYGWVHNFDFRQVNYVKHLEMAFFHLPYRFES